MTKRQEHTFFDALKDKGICIGAVVLSRTGHDMGRIYIVCHTKESFLFLCDGDKKSLKDPKKKRRSHVVALGYIEDPQNWLDTLLLSPIDQQNASLRKKIRDFIEEQKQEDKQK